MFKKLNPETHVPIKFTFNGTTVEASTRDTIATALLAAGHTTFKTTAKDGAPRGPYCMMGSCFECTVELDGEVRRQACLEPVADGMRVTSIEGNANE